MKRTALYRHYDAQLRLLYVGITCDPVARAAKHMRQSEWGQSVFRIEMEWFESRADALQAEIRAISAEKPIYNCGAGSRKKSALGKVVGGQANNSDLVARINAHLAATGETRSSFGKRVGNDFGLIKRLEDGCEPRAKTLDRINQALQVAA